MQLQQTYVNYIKNANYKNNIIRIELLDKEENIIDEISSDVLSCDISLINQSGIRRTSSLSLYNGHGKYNPFYQSSIWLDKRIRIYSGTMIDGVPFYQSQGIFVITDVNQESKFTYQAVSLSLSDKFCLIDGTFSGQIRANFNSYGNFLDSLYSIGNFELGNEPSTPLVPYAWTNNRNISVSTPTKNSLFNDYARDMSATTNLASVSTFGVYKTIEAGFTDNDWVYAFGYIKSVTPTKYGKACINRATIGFTAEENLSTSVTTLSSDYSLVDGLFQWKSSTPTILFGAYGNTTNAITDFVQADNLCLVNLTNNYKSILPTTPTIAWARNNVYNISISDIIYNILLAEIKDPKKPIIEDQAYSWLTDIDIISTVGESFSSVIENCCKRIYSKDSQNKNLAWTYYYDEDGVFHFEKMKDVFTTSIDWEFSPDKVHYLGGSNSTEFKSIKNHIFIWGVDKINNIPIYGEKKDISAQSPTSIARIGDLILVISEDLYTQKEVDDRADYELRKNIYAQETFDMTTLNVDILKEDSFINIQDENINLKMDRYWIQSLTIPIFPSGSCSIKCWKVRIID